MQYLILLILFLSPNLVLAKTIHYVLAKDEAIYLQAQEQIHSNLSNTASNLNKSSHIIDKLSLTDIHADDLVVSIGTKAAVEIEKLKLPNQIIFCFVDNYIIHESNFITNNILTIPLNQPIEKLLDTAEKVVEESYRSKILVVAASDNSEMLNKLNSLMQSYEKLEVVKIESGDLAAKKIEPYLYDVGVIVALNDAQIWSGSSAKWLLQQAFTYKVPVVGYSKKFLSAGALISVYTPVEAISQECANIIATWVRTGKLEIHGVYYPKAKIEVNSNIARSLHFSSSLEENLGK